MRVHPDHQRKGYGQMMLKLLEADAAKRGYATITLHTSAHLLAAQGLYKRNDYTEVARFPLGPLEIIRFEKKLTTT
jgi:ribosomal protein S18 acetylase RimI-like enzyme